jgi:hypothetical protein
MKIGFWEFLRASLQGEEPVNPVERRMAKRWVKERLKRLYPELRTNPEELENAYKQLGLEVHEGAGRGAGTVYEVRLPSIAEREE